MALSCPPLVDAATLADHLHDSDLRVFDATVELVRPPAGGPSRLQSVNSAAVCDHGLRKTSLRKMYASPPGS